MLRHRLRTIVLAVLGLTLALSLGGPARADYVVNLTQSGGNVLATGSGTINTTGLTFNGGGSFDGAATLEPSQGLATFGPTDLVHVGFFLGISGPSSFGTGGPDHANSGTGDFVGVGPFGGQLQLVVPADYVSNSQLNSSEVWSGQTFNSLGLTPGTYAWTWGSGADASSFTMNIGAAVPEPSSLALCGLGLAGVFGYLRRRRSANTRAIDA
jgi:hypothetical protein